MTTDSTFSLSKSQPPLQLLIACFALFIACFHLWVAIYPEISELGRNAFHFGAFAFLAAITYPLFGKKAHQNRLLLGLDVVLAIAILASSIYLVFAQTPIYDRGVKLTWLDWTASAICIVGAIELSRRVAGVVIPLMAIIGISYLGFWGKYVPGMFHFPGLGWETITFRSIFNDFALFGTITRISSTYVFLFIIFGAFLVRSGATDFVIGLAQAVAGKLVGGPGIIAVIASGLTGTITGSAVANTASTGVITIPLMKRAGFEPKFAGGVEAASSTGGQLMPPIMGAGAFVMASVTQISYEYIIAMALLPAILYFMSVAFFVRIEAKRLELPAMEDSGISFLTLVKEKGASFIIPIGLLIGMLVVGYTPSYAGVVGIVAVIFSSWLTATPMYPKDIIDALVLGSKNMIMTAVLLCTIGLVVNTITTAGIGNTFSLMISAWANGSILIAIILIAVASLVLGMGLPVTAAYIVLATLSAPALAGLIVDQHIISMIADGALPETARAIMMISVPDSLTLLAEPMPRAEAAALINGLPLEVIKPIRDSVIPAELAMTALLSAHMIVFWLSQDSNVTPPVALAAFTAAAIAKSPPMATGVASWKLAKGLYIMPVLFAFTPLLSGDWTTMLTIFAFALVGIYGLAAALQGCMEYRIGVLMRILIGAAGTACLWPHDILINIVGAVAVILLLVNNIMSNKNRPATPVAV